VALEIVCVSDSELARLAKQEVRGARRPASSSSCASAGARTIPDALTELAILDLIAASDGWSRPTAALAKIAGQITPSRSMKTPNRENPEVTEAMVVL
jgi:hypothetical protein